MLHFIILWRGEFSIVFINNGGFSIAAVNVEIEFLKDGKSIEQKLRPLSMNLNWK